MIIIDVGAGLLNKYSLLFDKHSNLKIYAFDPDPVNFQKLSNFATKINKDKDRLYIFNQVVGAKKGETKFYLCNDNSSSSTLPFDKTGIRKWKYPIGRRYFKTTEIIDVSCVTLSDIIDGYHISQIELLNIDTQGDSLNVLKSLSLRKYRKIKVIRVKAHSDMGFDVYKGQAKAYDVVRLLKRFYFQLYDSEDCSRDQEQLLTFKNEPLLNRKCPITIFV